MMTGRTLTISLSLLITFVLFSSVYAQSQYRLTDGAFATNTLNTGGKYILNGTVGSNTIDVNQELRGGKYILLSQPSIPRVTLEPTELPSDSIYLPLVVK